MAAGAVAILQRRGRRDLKPHPCAVGAAWSRRVTSGLQQLQGTVYSVSETVRNTTRLHMKWHEALNGPVRSSAENAGEEFDGLGERLLEGGFDLGMFQRRPGCKPVRRALVHSS